MKSGAQTKFNFILQMTNLTNLKRCKLFLMHVPHIYDKISDRLFRIGANPIKETSSLKSSK